MVLPKPFSTTGQQLASFDFFDLASGAAYKRFYAGETANNAYFLSTETNPSVNLSEAGPTTVASEELDFNTSTFSQALQIEGDVIVQVPTQLTNSTGGALNPMFVDFIVELLHVDASSNETSLGSETYRHSNNLGVGASSYQNALYKFSVSKTNIAIGEKLQLKVTMTNSGGLGTPYVYFDQLNGAVGTFISTQLTIDIPFSPQD